MNNLSRRHAQSARKRVRNPDPGARCLRSVALMAAGFSCFYPSNSLESVAVMFR